MIKTKDFNISHSFKTKSEVTDRTILIADAFGLGIDDEKDFTIYDNFKFQLQSNDIVYVTGDSGSGKSWILKNVFAKFPKSVSIDDIEIDDEEILIEGVGKDLNDAIKKLNLAGLGDAFLYLRKYSQISDGQKYRYKIAKFIDMEADVWILDEFCAKLDRMTAKIVSNNLQKIARRLGKCVVCATTHEDLKDALKPSLYIRKGLESEVRTERIEVDSYPKKLKDVYDNLTVEIGDKKDYEKLKKFHYRQSKLGAVKNIYKLSFKDEVIGALVITYPHLALKGRNIYTEGKYNKMTKAICTEINQKFECVARIVLHPKFRGLGLAYHFLQEYFKLSTCEYIETLAVMANYSPFFEKAGMTKIETEQDKRRVKLVKQLEDYEFNVALLSSKRYFKSVYDLFEDETKNDIADIVISIIDKYKGASVKIGSKIKSLGENWKELVKENDEFIMFVPELQRANTVYLIYKNLDKTT